MSKKIFIVEDEADIVEFYIEVLEMYGFDVVGSARNGAQAVVKFAAMSEHPDIIIMDHRMPIMTGIEATTKILEIDPDVKIIFASADDSIEKQARQLGVVSFEKKPFDLDRLIAAVREISFPDN